MATKTPLVVGPDGLPQQLQATDAIPYAPAAQGVVTLSLTTPNVVFATPVSFTNTAGAWAGALALNAQAANTVFGNFTGASATPTFAAAPTFSGANLTALSATAVASGTLADARLSANVPLLNAANAFTVGGQRVASLAAVVPLTLQGAASQTANLLELWGVSSTSTNRVQAAVTTAWADSTDATRRGQLSLGAYYTGTLQPGLTLTANATTGKCDVAAFSGSTPASLSGGLSLDSASPGQTGLQYFSNNLQFFLGSVLRFNLSTNKDFRVPSDHFFGWASVASNLAAADTGLARFGAASVKVTDGGAGLGSLVLGTSTAGGTPLTLQGVASQTAPLASLKQLALDGSPYQAGQLDAAWSVATTATRTGQITLAANYIGTAQEGVRVEANSGGVRLGFFAQAAVARPTLPAAATDAATTMALANSIRSALISLGLCQ